jgi:hypothetical protein
MQRCNDAGSVLGAPDGAIGAARAWITVQSALPRRFATNIAANYAINGVRQVKRALRSGEAGDSVIK